MANTHESLAALFTAIANAIRAKAGTAEPIVADTFPEKIEGLPTGQARFGNAPGQISTYQWLQHKPKVYF